MNELKADYSEFLEKFDILKDINISENKTKKHRSQIPVKTKLKLIESLKNIINEVKSKYNAYSYYHLKHIIREPKNQIEVKKQFKKLINGSNKYVDLYYITFLFNLTFDILDSIGGGTYSEIERKYHTGLYYYKDAFFKEKKIYENRFYSFRKAKETISNLAKDVVRGKISHISFENLLNPYIQTLIKYYRENFIDFRQDKFNYVFHSGRIDNIFVQKFLNLNRISRKKMFLNANLNDIDIFELAGKIELINLNNEIQKYIVFSIIMSKELNAHEIVGKAGVSYSKIYNHAKILKNSINPITNSYYIDNKRFTSITDYVFAIRKSNSPTGYTLLIPKKEKIFLIKEIKELINKLLNKYEYPYFIKKFLKNQNQQSPDYSLITSKLIQLSKIHKKLTYSDCFELFFISLEICDFISPKNKKEIAREFNRGDSFIQLIAELYLNDKVKYSKRFPSTKSFKKRILKIADDIVTGHITSFDICNIDSFEFQQLIKSYRKYMVQLETDNLIQKGYPSIGTKLFKKKIRNFKRRRLFNRYSINSDFIEYLESLSNSKLSQITKLKHTPTLKKEILIKCNNINENDEILKYIVYLILKSIDSIGKILKKSGTGIKNIINIAKILDVTICPATNTFYLKDYEKRFSR